MILEEGRKRRHGLTISPRALIVGCLLAVPLWAAIVYFAVKV